MNGTTKTGVLYLRIGLRGSYCSTDGLERELLSTKARTTVLRKQGRQGTIEWTDCLSFHRLVDRTARTDSVLIERTERTDSGRSVPSSATHYQQSVFP